MSHYESCAWRNNPYAVCDCADIATRNLAGQLEANTDETRRFREALERQTSLESELTTLRAENAALAKDKIAWKVGVPDLPKGKQRAFLCATRPYLSNGPATIRILVYCNEHIMGLSDNCDEPPAEAKPWPDAERCDGDYSWTCWVDEGFCEQCETWWVATCEVLAWAERPTYDPSARQARDPMQSKP